MPLVQRHLSPQKKNKKKQKNKSSQNKPTIATGVAGIAIVSGSLPVFAAMIECVYVLARKRAELGVAGSGVEFCHDLHVLTRLTMSPLARVAW